jgi:branched-chain amino acid transport system ATP-binding protein
MLQLQSVSAGYGGADVLQKVDLTVPTGSVVALLGANGAGKTTLLRAASGMIPVTGGKVIVDGVDATGTSIDGFARRGLTHIPEGRSIFPGMSVRENLLLFCDPGTESDAIQRVVEAFPRLGQRLTQVAGTLSGGEQQMLGLARCWTRQPRIVLVDEVSLGLAPKIVDEIFEFLARVVEQGASLLIVEQYVSRALRLADYVYVLAKGQVTFAGEPAEVDEGEIFRQYVGADVTA